jgi:hypothetical protein
MMCAGAKGPLAVTVVFALCFSLLLAFVRKPRPGLIVRGLVLAIPFLALYFLLYSPGTGDSMWWSVAYTARHSDLASVLLKILPRWLALTISVIWYIIQFDPLLFISLIFSLAYLFKFRSKPSPMVDIVTGGLLSAYFLLNTFKQMGSSETYFLTAMTPFGYICLVFCLQAFISARKNPASANKPLRPRRVISGLMLALFVACIGFNAVRSASAYYGLSGNRDMGLKTAFNHSRFSPKITTDQQLAEFYTKPTPRAYSITPQEYEGYIWLRDNTEKDAVIADGRYTKTNKYFYGSAFSERAFFLEGWGFVTMEDTNDHTPEKVRRDTFLRFFFDEEDEGYLLLMAREGCDYIVISQYLNPGLKLSGQYCDLVFENEQMAIYKLHEFAGPGAQASAG